MPQHTNVAIARIRYTRADLAALRAYLQRLPINQIALLYYTEEDLDALGCISEAALRNRLENLRDQLVIDAAQTNLYLADTLHKARQSGLWTPKLADFLVKAGETNGSTPQRQDSISAWFRPRVARVLQEESVRTLADLITLIEVCGSGWWKPVRCIGAGKAQRIEAWLKQHSTSLGELRWKSQPSSIIVKSVELFQGSLHLVPLERIRLSDKLSGCNGQNRAISFCQISARNDLEAIEAYLYRFRNNEKTQRSYRKEVERFLLWCIVELGKPMSSVSQEDCELYKDFLANPGPNWIGHKAIRHGARWKPFSGILSSVSQRYAIQVIRTFFTWLVNVRYLAGNPWLAVNDPKTPRMITPLQINKALPVELWKKLSREGGIFDQIASIPAKELATHYRLRGKTAQIDLPAQFRLAKATLLLLGEGGLRREEATFAMRNHLKPVINTDLWELNVLGKRNKWRTIFLSSRTVDSLEAHWKDRGLNFSFGMSEIPLLSPLFIPQTKESKQKHIQDNGKMRYDSGFSQDGLYRMIKTALKRISENNTLDLDDSERRILRQTYPHSLRHMFGTQAAAEQVPLDVLQRIMGHASLQTTTIYVQAEKQRSIEEMGNFFKKNR